MTEATVLIRPARPADAPLAAELLYQTLHGLADYVFGSEPRRPVVRTISDLFASKAENRLSHRFAHILEMDGEGAGILMAYPGADLSRLDRLTARCLLRWFRWPAMIRLAWRVWFIPGVEALPGEYYISNIAILPQYQGRRLGSRLLLFAEQQALRMQLSHCSLCVDMDNPDARRLYERIGYQVVLKQFYRSRAAQAGMGYFRMVKTLQAPSS